MEYQMTERILYNNDVTNQFAAINKYTTATCKTCKLNDSASIGSRTRENNYTIYLYLFSTNVGQSHAFINL